MAPTRKSRINKRYAGVSSQSPGKDVVNSSKSRQRGLVSFSPYKDAGNSNKTSQRKKKLSDKLGPPWSKEELEHFYDGYRKYGKDWKKVASAIRNRSAEMVEALYSMNRAYLSLPEGTASVIGLIAMMTDHYNVLEGSDSDQESNDASGLHQKPQKRKRGKDQPTQKDIFPTHPVTYPDGYLSLLKRRQSDGSQPRAVGKRTPRVPVQHYSHRKDYLETYISPHKKSRKSGNDAEDEVAHVAALALAEASQRAGSPQVSTPYKRQEHAASSPAQSLEKFAMHPQSETAHARRHGASVDEDWLEGSVGSRGAENGDYAKDNNSLMNMEGVGTVEVYHRGKKFCRKEEKVEDEDGGEACSGTEEGLNISNLKGKVDVEISNVKTTRMTPQSQRKRSKKLFSRDESHEFDALQTLANLSLMMPPCTMESESSVQLKEERTHDMEDKFGVPEATSTSQVRGRNKFSSAKQRVSRTTSEVDCTTSKKSKLGRDSTVEITTVSTIEQPSSDTKSWMKKRKLLGSKISSAETHLDSCTNEAVKSEIGEDESKPVVKGKRTSQTSTPSKQWKSVRPSECNLGSDYRRVGPDLMISTTQIHPTNENIPSKRRSKRKMYLPQSFYPEIRSSHNVSKSQVNKYSSSTKEKLSCLSSYLVRRWCTFEWFYSAIDYPWFAKREFEEYLNHVGLGHIPRLTRIEWGVIRSSLGKPRRFSEHFLREERDKLRLYRDSVRKHYTELRTGVRDGLPTDLAKPLTVGQRVIAIHPRTREVHNGSVLTVDHDKCRIRFDCPEIGVEFVMDVDCMPLNPLDNMPEALRRHNIASHKFSLSSKEPQKNGSMNFGGPVMFVSSGHPEKVPNPMNAVGIMHGKVQGDAIHAVSQLNAAAFEIGSAQPVAYGQPIMLANNQTREADIRAISELTRALDKKELLLLELRKTNDEVFENQSNGDYSYGVSEPFKKHYATVLVQLKEASGQVSSALLDLRQRNTYPGNALLPWHKTPANSGTHGCIPRSTDSFSIPQDSGSSVIEIVKGSTLKAQGMIDAAIQAFSSSKEGEDTYAKIREALDSIENKPSTSETRASMNRPPLQVNGSLAHQIQLSSSTAESGVVSDSRVSHLYTDTDKNEIQVPSEVITSCVATLLMIQTCTERQYPPADVAQILDSAVKSLHPCCPQNLQIYREIQTYMGRIKTQILALVPT